MTICIQNRQRGVTIRTVTVKKQLHNIMTYLECADKEISVVFATDPFVQELNRLYRDKDRPTNVLAFPQPLPPGGELASTLLGDVVVSLPTAAREACQLQQALEDRVVYLLLHGLLHLLGYDHERSPAERRQMERREREILQYMHG